MVHDTKIVEAKELSDGSVSYRVRCCEDPLTDSWHTVSVHATDLDESLEAHKQNVAATHEAKVQWREKHGHLIKSV